VAARLVDAIDALLPQTQCTRCGYPGCRPYAEALAEGRAEIDQCPPGGQEGIGRLASLLGRAPLPGVNPAYGSEEARASALIDEATCIGCTLCIQACPTDAILGAAKQMHTVLIEHCTGCALCVAPCPVDCISIVPLKELALRGAAPARSLSDVPVAREAGRWRARQAWRAQRLEREREERDRRLARKAQEKLQALEAQPEDPEVQRKRAVVRAAIERARARRAAPPEGGPALSPDENG